MSYFFWYNVIMKTQETHDIYIRMITKTEDYIEAHLNDRIRLADLAEHSGLSDSYFHRIFTLYTKESTAQFVSRIKMERSAIYLRTHPSVSITEIAYRYGYSETSAYCRAFKKHFFMTPSAYRDCPQDLSINKD